MRVSIESKGVLQGITLLDATSKQAKCHRFSHVPYALPPIANRRWRKPEPLPASFSYGSESHPGQFTRPSSMCPQLSRTKRAREIYSEDCLQLNIWVPIGQPPPEGWPVLFYIHGGFLQYGSNNSDDPSTLLSETEVKCIFVSPNYRLGIFGFLASREICSENVSVEANFGFWDQRLALEWTYENIPSFGGNIDNLTVGGLSAGSYSTFYQLAYDIGPQNPGKRIIKRIFMWSNGCGVEPKRIGEVQPQFDGLVDQSGISKDSSAGLKMKELRNLTTAQVMDLAARMNQKFIRPVLDDGFISGNLFRSIYSGQFGQILKNLGIHIMIGDLTQEFHLYKNAYPPTSYSSLIERLNWDFPRDIATTVAASVGISELTGSEWKEIFGKIYADLQVHSTLRGLIQCLSQTLPQSQIHRYRIDWRTQSVDKTVPAEFGATHATDLSIWLFGNGEYLTKSEKVVIQEWLKPVAEFVAGRDVTWGTDDVKKVRYLTSDGKIEIREDEVWDTKIPLWELTKKVTSTRTEMIKNRL